MGNDGVTANDTNDPDVGPNDLLNFPEYFSSTENAGNTTVMYKLDVPAGNYRIEFFSNSVADGSGNGEGELILGFDAITSSGSGGQFFNSVVTGTGHTNISMTATRVLGVNSYGATSEFGSPASPESDMEVIKTIVDNNEPKNSGTITYNLTLKNIGPSPVDLSSYDGSGFNPLVTSLFIDIMPPELTYLSENGTNVNCISPGPGSASLAGSLFEDHSDYSLILCSYTGPSTSLTSGQSFSVQIKATVTSPLPETFTNFAFHMATSTDPDTSTMNASFGTGNDILGILTGNVNNFTSVTWPIPDPQTPDPESGSGESTSNNASSGTLSNTGQSTALAAIISLVIVATTGLLMLKKSKVNKYWY